MNLRPAIAAASAARAGAAAIAAAAALCVSGPRTGSVARADDRDRDAAGAIVIRGAADEHDRSVVAAAVALAAREAGWALAREPVAPEDADRLLECSEPRTPWACLPASLGSRGIRQIFAFAVERSQSDSGAPMVVLTGRLIITAPSALVVRQRFCEHCADDRLTAASIELARQLLQDLAVRRGRTILEVASEPPGARITLDGQPIGATNATFNTFPGSHVVVVEKRGFQTATRSVIAEEGKTAVVSVALAPSAGPALPPRSRWRISAALVSSGVVALVGAGVLLELGTRGGPSRPDDKYQYAGATPAGAAIGIAGLAAVVAGIYHGWRTPPAQPGNAPALAPIRPSSGAASISTATGWIWTAWSTSF